MLFFQDFSFVQESQQKQKGAMLDGILRLQSDSRITEAALQQDGLPLSLHGSMGVV